MSFFIATSFGDTAIWQGTGHSDPTCQPMLYKDEQHPAIWTAACEGLGLDPAAANATREGEVWGCCGVSALDFCQC
jgi:hypothetical protein